MGLSVAEIALEVVLAKADPNAFASYSWHPLGLGATAVLLCWMFGSAELVAAAFLMIDHGVDPKHVGARAPWPCAPWPAS